MNVFCVAQAVNTALSFFVMLSGILYKCLYIVCDCLSAQCSCPVYPRPLRARSLTAIPGRRSSAHPRLQLHFVACIAIYGSLIATIRYSLLLSVHSGHGEDSIMPYVYD